MMDRLGADGPFMDGFFGDAYCGRYTYEYWDGHTAEINPISKIISRKLGDVYMLSQPLLAAFVNKIVAKGGIVISNKAAMTRTFGKLPLIHVWEVNEGPQVHLDPNPACLGNPAIIKEERDIYQDVYNKLRVANLYVYYGDNNVKGGLTYPSVPQQMYPITVQEIHSGYIKGRERLITAHSGVYGWHGDHSLHFNYLYDTRGHQIPHNFLTTADSAGVRTKIDLEEKQIAVIKKIPLKLNSKKVVNLMVLKYDETGIGLVLNGKGKCILIIKSGEYKLQTGSVQEITIGKQISKFRVNPGGVLNIALELNGNQKVTIRQ